MKTIYDISVLGRGYHFESSRTGIFRVIESLGEQLVKKKEIDAYSAGGRIGSYFDCHDYLKTNRLLQRKHLISPRLNSLLLKFIQNIFQKPQSGMNHSLVARIKSQFCDYFITPLSVSDILNTKKMSDFDIYHATFYPIPDEVNQIKNIKKVLTIYDLIPIKYPEYCQKSVVALVKDILKSIDKETWITCISQSTKDDLCDFLDINPDKVFVTPLAASNKFYRCTASDKIISVKEKLGITACSYVLSLATLEPRKNIITTIKSFCRLMQENKLPDTVLVLVGTKGWDFDGIFDEIESSTARNKVIVTGYVNDDDLAPLYSGATVFVYPSFYEGFGLPPLEAMQCGTPVITSNTSSLPEVVGDAGVMLDPLDIDGICDAIYRIFSSKKKYRQMSEASILQAKTFSWEKCADQTIEVYRAALS